MGWERKRGKLHEFNRLLRGAQDTSFMPIGGTPPTAPRGVRYVITLDADTRLPIGAVRPAGRHRRASAQLRRAWIRKRQARGGGLRASCSRASRRSCRPPRRARCSSACSPRPRAWTCMRRGVGRVSGSVRRRQLHRQGPVRRGCLRGRAAPAALPEDAVLSHDLLESVFARCALVSDIELFEDFPSHAEVAAARAAPLGTRRLATAALDLRRAQAAASARSAAGRCSTICAARCWRPRLLATLVASWSIPQAPRLAWLLAARRGVVVAGAARLVAGAAAGPARHLLAPSLAHACAEELRGGVGYAVVALATSVARRRG